MEQFNADTLDRTLKLDLDDGRARSVEEAYEIAAGYVLQVVVGRGVVASETSEALLMTVLNSGRRAFFGGVHVCLNCPSGDPLSSRWAAGQDIAAVVEAYRCTMVQSLDPQYPTLVIGSVDQPPQGSIVLYATWQGWSGGVLVDPSVRLPESSEFPLAGVLAAALGVSEAFQHVRGSVFAGRRNVGLSLWDPESEWLNPIVVDCKGIYLPSRLWLIGLGHLGQAYAWALGLLPYSDPSEVTVMLQDYDAVKSANRSTGMLSEGSSVGVKKSRLVAGRLEKLGFCADITERPFDGTTRRRAGEPGVALVGVDDPAPRRLLEQAGFDLIVDAGLGAHVDNYLNAQLTSFPASAKAIDVWPPQEVETEATAAHQPAYVDHKRRMLQLSSLTEGEIECGILEVAGRSVGAAFVGCFVAAFVLAEVLRWFVEGPRFETISFPLANPNKHRVARGKVHSARGNPGFVRARPATT